MDAEDLDPKTKKPKPRDLSDLSIDALNDYIADLEAEIERVRADIAAKQAALSAADSIFKS
jgi:uncharacterized small protein (DUF1192 family)